MKNMAVIFLVVLIVFVTGYFILHIYKQNIEYKRLNQENVYSSVNNRLSGEEDKIEESLPIAEEYNLEVDSPRFRNDILLIY